MFRKPMTNTGAGVNCVCEELKEVFKVDKNYPDRLTSRESSTIEFKESFSKKAIPRYAKTMAAFANCHGGFIIFGVKNNPHTFPGLLDKKLEVFTSLDPELLTQELNQNFSPEIKYDIGVYSFENRPFGYIRVTEAADKPVMASRNYGDNAIVTEGAIYYRYRGRSQLIRYSELRQIMDDIRNSEQRLWMKLIGKISKAGVRNVGIFDINTGVVSCNRGNSFYLDQAILSKLSFIKEGEFSEVRGKPTLRVIGDVKSISPISIMPRVIHAKGITAENIIDGFLQNNQISNPLDYVQQICSETTGFLPCYYYLRMGRCKSYDYVKIITGMVSRKSGKDLLLQRLSQKSQAHQHYSLEGNGYAAKRRDFVADICASRASRIESTDVAVRYCEAVLAMKSDELIKSEAVVREVLHLIFLKEYQQMKSSWATTFRKAVCWLDEVLNMSSCSE